MFPLSPLPFCRVLRSRWDLHAKPLRRFDAVGGYINVTDSHDAVISGFNSTAYRLAVYASCRRCRRLRNTRFRVVANLSRAIISDDRTHPVDFFASLHLPRLRAFHGARGLTPRASGGRDGMTRSGGRAKARACGPGEPDLPVL